jgi:hypothetical protein
LTVTSLTHLKQKGCDEQVGIVDVKPVQRAIAEANLAVANMVNVQTAEKKLTDILRYLEVFLVSRKFIEVAERFTTDCGHGSEGGIAR